MEGIVVVKGGEVRDMGGSQGVGEERKSDTGSLMFTH